MADTERQDRTQPATAKRLEDARREGRIPRSRDLTAAAVMLTAGIALTASGESLAGKLGDMMRNGLLISRETVFDEGAMVRTFGDMSATALHAVAPVLMLTLVAALGAPLALGGWAFSGKALAPDFSRLNPAAGLGRMLSLRSWVELGKALGKFAIVGLAGVLVLRNNMDQLMGLGSEPIHAAIGHSMSVAGQALIALTAALVVIAAIDVPYQLWQYHQEMRMTRTE
ncbi:MAG: EscU/YscU/HrcU family type III secretion system export apparatus switch protein, partial [Pseudomonadota bacterium]